MKSVLIVGAGRFGRHMAQKLNQLGHQVMIVDGDEERVRVALPYATRGLIGDTTSPEFMKTLGVNDYDLCVVAIGDDFQSSLETTLLLKELGAKKVVSRAARGIHAKFLLRNGADEVVYPEKELAEWSAIGIFLIIFLITSNLMTRIQFLRLTFLKLGCTKRCPI